VPTIAIRGLGQQLLQVATEMGEPQLLLDLLALQRHRQGCGLNTGQHDLLLVEDQVDAAGAGGIEDRITAVIAPGVAERPCREARQARLVGNRFQAVSEFPRFSWQWPGSLHCSNSSPGICRIGICPPG